MGCPCALLCISGRDPGHLGPLAVCPLRVNGGPAEGRPGARAWGLPHFALRFWDSRGKWLTSKYAHKCSAKGQEAGRPGSSPLASPRSSLQASSLASAGLHLSETCSLSSSQNTDAQRLRSGNKRYLYGSPAASPGNEHEFPPWPQGLGLETGFCFFQSPVVWGE